MPGRPCAAPVEEMLGGWSCVREGFWVVVRGLSRLSSSNLSAGPILPVSWAAAFA